MQSLFQSVTTGQRQVLGFILVGCATTVFSLSLSGLVVYLLDIRTSVASGVGYFSGVFLGYLLNKRITFKAQDQQHRKVFLPYVLVYSASFIVSFSLIELVDPTTKLASMMALLGATLVTTITNFSLSKWVVFKA